MILFPRIKRLRAKLNNATLNQPQQPHLLGFPLELQVILLQYINEEDKKNLKLTASATYHMVNNTLATLDNNPPLESVSKIPLLRTASKPPEFFKCTAALFEAYPAKDLSQIWEMLQRAVFIAGISGSIIGAITGLIVGTMIAMPTNAGILLVLLGAGIVLAGGPVGAITAIVLVLVLSGLLYNLTSIAFGLATYFVAAFDAIINLIDFVGSKLIDWAHSDLELDGPSIIPVNSGKGSAELTTELHQESSNHFSRLATSDHFQPRPTKGSEISQGGSDLDHAQNLDNSTHVSQQQTL